MYRIINWYFRTAFCSMWNWWVQLTSHYHSFWLLYQNLAHLKKTLEVNAWNEHNSRSELLKNVRYDNETYFLPTRVTIRIYQYTIYFMNKNAFIMLLFKKGALITLLLTILYLMYSVAIYAHLKETINTS